jgi:chaperonin GroEL (HSP60 family)
MVGGVTPSEVEESGAVDDAICAVRASKDGGVVAGGGIALFMQVTCLVRFCY